jgi:hypothetical protein
MNRENQLPTAATSSTTQRYRIATDEIGINLPEKLPMRIALRKAPFVLVKFFSLTNLYQQKELFQLYL